MANGYLPPRVEINQVFEETLTTDLPILAPFIFGPQKDFLDLSDEVDLADALAGLYDYLLDTDFEVPGIDPAAVLDADAVEVQFDDLEALYFEKIAGAGAYDYKILGATSNQVAPDPVASGPSLVEFTNSAGTVFARDAAFLSRDVRVGDVAEVEAIVGLDTITHKSPIAGFVNEVIAATVGLAVADAANVATVAGSVGAAAADGGNTGDDTVTSAGAYVGSLEDNVLTDTYTLEVISGGIDPVIAAPVADGANTGDAEPVVSAGSYAGPADDTYEVEVTLGGATGVAEVTVTSLLSDGSGPTVVSAATPFAIGSLGITFEFTTFGGDTLLTLGDKWTVVATASLGRFKVTSLSGTDDVPVLVYPGSGVSFAVGTRGVTADSADGGDLAITLADKYTIAVVKAVDVVVATSAGTYSGAVDLTYTAEVVEGGIYGAARLLVTSTDIDSSGPLLVTAAATPFSVGTKGVTISFAANTQGGLMKGDKWTVVVTSVKKGEIKTLILEKALPILLITGTPALTLRLHLVQQNKDIPRFKIDVPSVEAWVVGVDPLDGSDIVTIKAALKTTDPSWFDGSGVLPLEIRDARVFIGWEALRLENSGAKFTISGPDYVEEIEQRLGRIDPKNPMAFAFFLCSLNAVNRPIKGMALEEDSVLAYSKILDFVKECDDVYSFVPLTLDRLVHQALDAHIQQMSTPAEGRWRVGFISRSLVTTEDIYTTRVDGEGDVVDLFAKIIDDPTTIATDYRLLVADDGQDVDFFRDNVVPGNVVRHSFMLDLDGEPTWSETAVEEVVSSTELRLAESLVAPVTLASKFEIFRNLDKTEQATTHGAIADSLADRRLFLHYPDLVGRGGEFVEGFYFCAATAGMKAALPPHQGFTNFQIQGFDDFSRAFEYFNRDQLNILGGSGVYIGTQEVRGSVPFVRHQLSTDNSSVTFQEMSITTNVDSISYFFKDLLTPFIGVWNVVPGTLDAIRRTINGGVDTLVNIDYPRIGPQLLSGDLLRLEQNETFKDRIDADLDIEVPFPLNNLTLNLIV